MNNYYPNYNQFYGQMQMPKMANAQPMQSVQPMQTMEQYQPQQIYKQIGLQGKSVDSIDVVKAMDIPLDFSISYFPLTDGSAIVSKQLQNDGTSKIVVYKPTQEEKKDTIQFATLDDIQDAINDLDLSDIQDLKDEIKDIKKQLKEFKVKKGKDD